MKADVPAIKDLLSDQELVRQVRGGDTNAFSFLAERYLHMLRGRAARYAGLVGADAEDFVQEGMFALFRAVRGYDQDSGVKFSTYAITCINNSMNTAVRHHLRGSRQNIDVCLDELNEHDLYHQSNLHEKTVEDACIYQETIRLRFRQIETLLSAFEQQVLRLYLRGHTYQQIAHVLSTTTKAVDNALQRVRRKLRPEM